jgi:hypothetical protein
VIGCAFTLVLANLLLSASLPIRNWKEQHTAAADAALAQMQFAGPGSEYTLP